MPVPTLPFSVQVQVSRAPASGSPLVADPLLSVVGSVTQISDDRYVLTGTGSRSIDFGTLYSPGAKFVLVHHEQGTDPITMFSGGVALPPGGIFLVAANSDTGMAELDIDYTTDCVVRCRVMG